MGQSFLKACKNRNQWALFITHLRTTDWAISVFQWEGFVTFVICVVNVLFSTSSVTWRKNNVEMRSGALQLVNAEGEKHSLVIKQMSPKSAGSYCVTAVNAAGSATCSATLYIQSGEEAGDGWCHCDTSTGI